jgi:hypothetical protein
VLFRTRDESFDTIEDAEMMYQNSAFALQHQPQRLLSNADSGGARVFLGGNSNVPGHQQEMLQRIQLDYIHKQIGSGMMDAWQLAQPGDLCW